MADEPKGKYAGMRILGRSGLNRQGGHVYEEQLSKLSGSRAVKVYQEMRDNDSIIGAFLFMIKMLIRKVKWTVKPASEDKADMEAAKFVEECRQDMSHTQEDLMAEILSMLIYGWVYFEIVYKRRSGPGKDPTKRSRYTDGKIGWRKIEIRSQDTLDQWEFDDDGGVTGMWQSAPPTYERVFIPIEKALLFRTESAKNNPEGRALEINTPIPSPDGWTAIGDLKIGDRVFDERGMVRHVVAKSETWKQRSVYDVVFSSGATIVADENHQWSVTTFNDRFLGKQPRILTTKELYDWLERPGKNPSFCAGRTAIIEGVNMPLPVDPYVLGYWLGDGTGSSGAITVSVDDFESLRTNLEVAGLSASHNGDLTAYTINLKTALRLLGVLNNKHIPQPYLRASYEQRLALLQGLMDSDGTATARQDDSSVWFNSNEKLVSQFCELVRSLGGRPHVRIHSKPGHSGGIVNGRPIIQRKTLYAVSFYLGLPAHRLPRKLARQSIKSSVRVSGHFIREIRFRGKGDTVCIEVDSPSHLFLAGEGMVPTHNSLLRNAYRDWYYKKRIQEIEAIGIERDLVGIPIMEVPPEIMLESASSDHQTLRTNLEKMVSEIRRDEREGVLIPAEEYAGDNGESVKSGFKLRLLQGGGQRQIDTDKIIRRYESRILMTVMAQFLLLGQDKVGSFSLASESTDLFAVAIGAILDSIASVFNRYAIPRLFEVNGWQVEALPELVPGDIEKPDLEKIGKFVESLVKAGVLRPGPATERHFRALAELPDLEEDDMEELDEPAPRKQPQKQDPKADEKPPKDGEVNDTD